MASHIFWSLPGPPSTSGLEQPVMVCTSNGKSSIVEERLYSFFFALLPKNESFVFFRFSYSSQSLTKTFVLLRFCKILKRFTSFSFVFANFWNTPIRFTLDFESVGLIPFALLRSCQILEQPGRFCVVLAKLKTKPNGFRFDLWIIVVPFSFALKNCLTNQFVFASIFRSLGTSS